MARRTKQEIKADIKIGNKNKIRDIIIQNIYSKNIKVKKRKNGDKYLVIGKKRRKVNKNLSNEEILKAVKNTIEQYSKTATNQLVKSPNPVIPQTIVNPTSSATFDILRSLRSDIFETKAANKVDMDKQRQDLQTKYTADLKLLEDKIKLLEAKATATAPPSSTAPPPSTTTATTTTTTTTTPTAIETEVIVGDDGSGIGVGSSSSSSSSSSSAAPTPAPISNKYYARIVENTSDSKSLFGVSIRKDDGQTDEDVYNGILLGNFVKTDSVKDNKDAQRLIDAVSTGKPEDAEYRQRIVNIIKTTPNVIDSKSGKQFKKGVQTKLAIELDKITKQAGKGEIVEEQEEDESINPDALGLTNIMINKIMEGKDPAFVGTYGSDQIHSIHFPKDKKEISFIANTSPYPEPGHWVAVRIKFADKNNDGVIEFYDSFGNDIDYPPYQQIEDGVHRLVGMYDRFARPYQMKNNNVMVQSRTSDTCGFFATKFLLDRAAGKSFKEATHFDIIEKNVKEGETDIAKFREFVFRKFPAYRRFVQINGKRVPKQEYLTKKNKK